MLRETVVTSIESANFPNSNDVGSNALMAERKVLSLSKIRVRKDHRPVDRSKVLEIKRSISDVGLGHPIVVYRRKKKGGDVRYYLSSGRHRLEALKALGYSKIEVVIIARKYAELWSIIENLHRNELTEMQRSQNLVRYAELVQQLEASSTPKGGRQPHSRGITAAAKHFRIDRGRVRAAFDHERIGKKARAALVKAKLDDNASFLSKVAKVEKPRAQLKLVLDEVTKRNLAKPKRRSNSSDEATEKPFFPDFAALEKDWKRSDFRLRFEGAERRIRIAFVKKTFLAEVKKIAKSL